MSGAATRAWIERPRRLPPQCFGQELLVCRGQGVRADVSRGLRALVRRLVVAKSSLHVDAIDGVVDAVLNIPEVAHDHSGMSIELTAKR
jgi:hypothetical protein